MRQRMNRRALSGGLLLGGVALLGVACGEPSRSATRSVPMVAQPMTNPPRQGPGDIEVLTIEVLNGKFANRVYNVQTGAIRLRFVARGSGPHSVRITNLMQARLLPVGEVTEIGLTATPGEYVMMTDGGARDTAILNVRPIGGR